MSLKEVYFEGPPPWGFRMTGGVDTGHSLRISRVNPGSKAEAKGLREGDLITTINGQSTKCLTNSESHALLRSIKENLHLGLNEDKTSSPRRRSKEIKLTQPSATAGDKGESTVESKEPSKRRQKKSRHSKKRTFKGAIKSLFGYRETEGQIINLHPTIPDRKSEECDSIGASTLPDDNTSQVYYDNLRENGVNGGDPSENGSTRENPSFVSKNSDCSEVIRILDKTDGNVVEPEMATTPTPSPVKPKTVTFGQSQVCEVSFHHCDSDPASFEEPGSQLIECKATEVIEFPEPDEIIDEHQNDTLKPATETVDIHWPSFIKVVAPPAIHHSLDNNHPKKFQPVFINPRRYLEAISEESSDLSDSGKTRDTGQFKKPSNHFDRIPEDWYGSNEGIDTSWQEGKSLEEVSDVPIVSDSHSDSDVLIEDTVSMKNHRVEKPGKKPFQRKTLPSTAVVKNVVSSYYNSVNPLPSPVHLETVQKPRPLSGPISEVVEIVYIDSSDSEVNSKSEADYSLDAFKESDQEDFGDDFLEKFFEITGQTEKPPEQYDSRSIPESTISSSSRATSKFSNSFPLTLRELGVLAVLKMPDGASLLKELGLEYIDTDQYSGYVAECSENSCSSVQFNSEKEQDCDIISERDLIFDHFSGSFPWIEEFSQNAEDKQEETQPTSSTNSNTSDDRSSKKSKDIACILDLHCKFSERRGYFEPENLIRKNKDTVEIEFIEEEIDPSTALKKYHEMRQQRMKQSNNCGTGKHNSGNINVSPNESIKDELKKDADELVGNSRLLDLIQSIEGKSSNGESKLNASNSEEPIYVNVENKPPVVTLDTPNKSSLLIRRHSDDNINVALLSNRRLARRSNRPRSLPPPGEILRRRMYDEYMDKLAAMSERRQMKVVKLSKCPQDTVVGHEIGSLEKEFMGKVKERNLKLGLENEETDDERNDGVETPFPKHIRELMDQSDDRGIWSPAQTPEAERKKISFADIEIEESKDNEPQDAQPPIWIPKSIPSPTLERKFRSVNFQSPPPKRKEYQSSSEKKPELPKDLPIEINRSTKLSSSASENSLSSPLRLPSAQNPTITLLQKAREGEIPKGAHYLDDIPDRSESKLSPNEIIYSVKKEYSTVDEEGVKKVVELTPRKFVGIGPTTKEGIPIGLRSEVKEDNQQKWYKRMYDSLHKADHDKDYVTVRYKTKRKGQYPYSYAGGYASEPERLNYDSDASLSKYATLDRRKIRNKESDFTSSTLPRNKYGPDVKHAVNVYKNQPGRIENYEPGHSSISEIEKKQWWDEVLDIFNGEINQQGRNLYSQDYRTSSYSHKDAGYDSDSTLVFKRRDDMSQTLSPAEQKMAYKVIQRGGEVPLHGLRKTMPDRPKEDSEIEYFPLSPTLTRIRVHKKSPKPTEKVFYPVTPVEPVFGAYKRFARISTVPSPPRRESSRNISSSLKLYTKIASSTATSRRSTSDKLVAKPSSSVKDMGQTSSRERTLLKKSPSVTPIPSTSRQKKEVLRKSPELKAPSEVKKALKDTKGASSTVVKSSTTLYSSSGFSKSPSDDKSLKVTVAISSKGKDVTRSSSSASSKTDSRKPSPILSKSTSSVLKPRLTDSTLSLVKSSRPSSRASTPSANIVVEPLEKKKLKSGNGEPKKKREKNSDNPAKNGDKKDEERKRLKKKTDCLKKKVASKKQDKENIPEKIPLSEEECSKMSDSNVKSDSFFQQLLLKGFHSPDPSAAHHSPPIIERAKKFVEPEHFCYRSEPSLCHLNVYLSQRKPVTESRFRSLERQDRGRRALSPFFGTPAFYDKLDKFDSSNNVWDRTQSFRDTPTYESIKGRSSSEPPTCSPGGQDRDTSPAVSRSPSRRRIRRSTSRTVESIAGVKRKCRSKSLNEADRSPNLGSSSSLSQSTDYRSYVFDMIHSTRKSERFKELHRFYSSLERMAELEKTTSNSDLRPRLKGEEVIDFDRWKQLRTKERAEIELNNLYQKLMDEQREKDLLFLPKEATRWQGDIGLRSKEKSVEDLRMKFQKMVESSDDVKKPMTRDVYKPLWRGNSVVNLAHSLTTITGSKRGRPICEIRDDKTSVRPFGSKGKREIGSKLWSSLSMDQVNALKNQLTEIYTTVSNLKRERIDKIKQNIEEYEMNVAELKSPDSLHVRSNSLLSPEQLYSPSVRKKLLQRQECLKADSIASIPHWKAQKPLTEPEKKKLSMSLSAEVKERIKRKKHGSLVIPRETLGAVAAIKGTKKAKSASTSDTSPRTCYSFMDEDSSGKMSAGNKDFLLVLTPKEKESDVKRVVDDWGGKECAKLVQTTSSSSSSASTVIHLGSKEDCKQLDVKVNDTIHEKEKVESRAVSPHGNLYSSQSYTDLKELFGEKQASTYATIPLKSSKKSIFSSVDSLCKSASPDPVRYYRAYLNLVKSGDVRKLREKFESYDDIYNLRKSTPIQKTFQSDPDLTRDFLSRKGGELSKVVVKGQELGDVQWLRKKFEPRKVSPVPFRIEDRFMPRINVISKTASLQQRPRTPSQQRADSSTRTGCVDRLKQHFELKGMSILGQMYTSTPEITELHDIAPYLECDWVAHRNPRSPKPVRKGRELAKKRPSSESPIRQSILKNADIFANQHFDPEMHRPLYRYQPEMDHDTPRGWHSRQWSSPRPTVTFREPIGKSLSGRPRDCYSRHHYQESPHRYVESEVNIHYKTPVRNEAKVAWPEEELAEKQAEIMRRIYQEQRRTKYLNELHDMYSRRHTDNFIPSQKSPIPLNRYDDFPLEPQPPRPRDRTPEPKLVARALYNFVGQSPKELSFRKGDIIYVRRQIDKNWYEGEHNAMIGLFPFNYVEIVPYDGIRSLPRKASEGQARAKFNFQAQTHLELSLVKGELVLLTRRVDENWFEGRIGNRKGIFPVSYVEVLVEPGERALSPSGPISSKPIVAPASHSVMLNGAKDLGYQHYQPPRPALYSSSSLPSQSRLHDVSMMSQSLHIETQSDPIPYRVLYNYRPQNDDELELKEGDVVYVMEKCDDGWYVGSLHRNGQFGTFPGNYVERITP